jgi:hypothetical protein
MEENSRSRDWKSGKMGKKLEPCPKQDSLETHRGSPMLLRERKETSQVKLNLPIKYG